MSINRRGFLQASAGLLINIALPGSRQTLDTPQGPPPINPYSEFLDPPPIEVIASGLPRGIPNAFIHIAPDETVTLLITRAEMGQGPADGMRPNTCRGARLRLVQGARRIRAH